MSNKYHIAATGKNAGQYVPCDAKVSCRIGGEHISKDQAEIKNLILSGEEILAKAQTQNNDTQPVDNHYRDVTNLYSISHQDILKREGFDIISFEEFGYYQGDYASIVAKDGKIGLAVIGYGSCGGCDALLDIKENTSYAPDEEDFKNNPKDEESIYTATTDFVGNSMMTLNQIQSKLSGFHFAKESLSDGEREILYMAEALLHRVNDINETVKPRKPRQPRRSDEMKALLKQKEDLAESQELLQDYANSISNNVRYGTYEELKNHITGEDNVIKWYSSDAGFAEARKNLLDALDKAFDK